MAFLRVQSTSDYLVLGYTDLIIRIRIDNQTASKHRKMMKISINELFEAASCILLAAPPREFRFFSNPPGTMDCSEP